MSTPPRLDRERVVEAAVAMADEQGLERTSMRALADQLKVTPMALYNHVANRSELIDNMLDQVIAGIPDVDAEGEWMHATRARIFAARAAFAAHPWAREAIETRPLATPLTLRHLDALIAGMFAGGLSADLVHHTMHALSTRMWGFTRDGLPTPQPPSDPDERARAMAAFATSYPAIVRMATTSPHAGEACDDDAEFGFALDLILAGTQRLHEQGWTRAMPVDHALRG
ncbi:transcriptional regulator [Microbacterium testaceum StLB037]|uniref:Transcriptional regulator n=1 Tax=Microbacterium testaceum (strain StLB037) TaxID=979556 RepID=E8N9R2_MICTS|nr:TetR/AcrR family transcriptional regulator C-terminal domain-containing protein [Microbacterium testaceum]BAJ74531.1 transcriptional regulator [Microbacterium testaceum StLB037]